MKFTYIDIGTCDFDTNLVNLKSDETILLVEPLFCYLKNLPNLPNAIKCPFAIADYNGYDYIYNISEQVINSFQLPSWVRGCNSFSKPHPTLLKQFPYIQQEKIWVPVITLEKLFEIYQVTEVVNIKIDTEGYDHIILKQLLHLVNKVKVNTIEFEYINSFGNTDILDKLIIEFNFPHITVNGDNRILRR
jgi:FkbM family methyltransferase